MLLTEAYISGQSSTVEFGKPDPAATFMVRHFGDDLLNTLAESGFQVTRWDHTGRNDGHCGYFFLCEKRSDAKARVQVA